MWSKVVITQKERGRVISCESHLVRVACHLDSKRYCYLVLSGIEQPGASHHTLKERSAVKEEPPIEESHHCVELVSPWEIKKKSYDNWSNRLVKMLSWTKELGVASGVEA